MRFIFLLPIVIYAAAHILLIATPDLFWWMTRKAHWFGSQQFVEDAEVLNARDRAHFEKNIHRYAEHLGPNHIAKIAVEAVIAVTAFQVFRLARRRARPGLATLYFVVSAGALVVAAEEARWGETFGLELFPQHLTHQVKSANLQAEMTLHNMPSAQRLTGNAKVALALYGLIGGILVARLRREWLLDRAFYFFIPHPLLAPGFAVVLLYSLERGLYKWIVGRRVTTLWSALQEPSELVAVLTLLLFCWLVLRTVNRWPQSPHAT